MLYPKNPYVICGRLFCFTSLFGMLMRITDKQTECVGGLQLLTLFLSGIAILVYEQAFCQYPRRFKNVCIQ